MCYGLMRLRPEPLRRRWRYDGRGAVLLRAGRADLGTRGHDQGAALEGTPGWRGVVAGTRRRSSGASIWMSRRLPAGMNEAAEQAVRESKAKSRRGA